MTTTTKILIGLGAGVLVFEFLEHVVFPLIWLIIDRRRRPADPLTKLIGLEAKVTAWQQDRGQVFVRGEIWQAVSKDFISPGDKVIVQNTDGLVLTVSASKSDSLGYDMTRPVSPRLATRNKKDQGVVSSTSGF